MGGTYPQLLFVRYGMVICTVFRMAAILSSIATSDKLKVAHPSGMLYACSTYVCCAQTEREW